MYESLLFEFEKQLRNRNPTLADRLQPGIPKGRILKLLKHHDIFGNVEPIVDLFSWRDGPGHGRRIKSKYISPFPNSTYEFKELDFMLCHYHQFEEFADYNPRFSQVVERFFPLFWSGSTGWLAPNLGEDNHDEVVLIEGESDNMVHGVYRSFGEFLEDAVRANRDDAPLSCFEPLGPYQQASVPGWPTTATSGFRARQSPRLSKSIDGVPAESRMKSISASEQAVMVRTDYSDPATWEAIVVAAQSAEDPFMFNMQVVDDRDYEGASVDNLMAALGEGYAHGIIVIVDKHSVADPEHPLLVVDLLEERGRGFRAVPSQIGAIENNLSTANMGFGEFAEIVGDAGVFRGIPGM